MVTPTIIFYEKYRESVLVPDIRSLERKFKLDRYFLRDLIEETKRNKRKANYDDCRFEVVHQDSTPLNEPSNNLNFSDANYSNAERREPPSGDNESKEEEKSKPQAKDDEPDVAPLGEDDWICDHCKEINKMTHCDCKK